MGKFWRALKVGKTTTRAIELAAIYRQLVLIAELVIIAKYCDELRRYISSNHDVVRPAASTYLGSARIVLIAGLALTVQFSGVVLGDFTVVGAGSVVDKILP